MLQLAGIQRVQAEVVKECQSISTLDTSNGSTSECVPNKNRDRAEQSKEGREREREEGGGRGVLAGILLAFTQYANVLRILQIC